MRNISIFRHYALPTNLLFKAPFSPLSVPFSFMLRKSTDLFLKAPREVSTCRQPTAAIDRNHNLNHDPNHNPHHNPNHNPNSNPSDLRVTTSPSPSLVSTFSSCTSSFSSSPSSASSPSSSSSSSQASPSSSFHSSPSTSSPGLRPPGRDLSKPTKRPFQDDDDHDEDDEEDDEGERRREGEKRCLRGQGKGKVKWKQY